MPDAVNLDNRIWDSLQTEIERSHACTCWICDEDMAEDYAVPVRIGGKWRTVCLDCHGKTRDDSLFDLGVALMRGGKCQGSRI